MVRTAFGRFLYNLRLHYHDETLKKMAKKLKVSSSFLSAVEHGKKEIPVKLIERIIEAYGLLAQDIAYLLKMVDLSMSSIKIDLKNANCDEKVVAILFVRNLKNLSKETLIKIEQSIKEDLKQ